MRQGIGSIRRCAALTILVALGFETAAQTSGFYLDVAASDYIAGMLAFTRAKVIDCPVEFVVSLSPLIEEYQCLESEDNPTFMRNIDQYLDTYPRVVAQSSDWHHAGKNLFYRFIMENGYVVTMAADPSTNYVIMVGDAKPLLAMPPEPSAP